MIQAAVDEALEDAAAGPDGSFAYEPRPDYHGPGMGAHLEALAPLDNDRQALMKARIERRRDDIIVVKRIFFQQAGNRSNGGNLHRFLCNRARIERAVAGQRPRRRHRVRTA